MMSATVPEQIEHLDFDPTFKCERRRYDCDRMAEVVLRFQFACECPGGSALICARCLMEIIGQGENRIEHGRCATCRASIPKGGRWREWLLIEGWGPIK